MTLMGFPFSLACCPWTNRFMDFDSEFKITQLAILLKNSCHLSSFIVQSVSGYLDLCYYYFSSFVFYSMVSFFSSRNYLQPHLFPHQEDEILYILRAYSSVNPWELVVMSENLRFSCCMMLLDSFVLINSLPIGLLLQFLSGSDAVVHSGVSCSLFPDGSFSRQDWKGETAVVGVILSSCVQEWGVLQILSYTQGLNCLEVINFCISHKRCTVLNQCSSICPFLSPVDILGGVRCREIS